MSKMVWGARHTITRTKTKNWSSVRANSLKTERKRNPLSKMSPAVIPDCQHSFSFLTLVSDPFHLLPSHSIDLFIAQVIGQVFVLPLPSVHPLYVCIAK